MDFVIFLLFLGFGFALFVEGTSSIFKSIRTRSWVSEAEDPFFVVIGAIFIYLGWLAVPPELLVWF